MEFYYNFPETCLWPTKFTQVLQDCEDLSSQRTQCVRIVSCSIPENKYKLSIESINFPSFPKWSLGRRILYTCNSPLWHEKASPVPLFVQIQEMFSSSEIRPWRCFLFSSSVCFHGSTAGFLSHHQSHQLTVELLNLLYILCLVCSIQQALQEKVA